MNKIPRFCLEGESPTLTAIIWSKDEKDWTQDLSSILIKILCNRIICNATISL